MKHPIPVFLCSLFTLIALTGISTASEKHSDIYVDVTLNKNATCTGRKFAGIISCGCDQQPVCTSGKQCDVGFRLTEPRPYCVLGCCEYSGYSAEPDNSSVTVPSQENLPTLRGWSDIHEHPFANLAYGGSVFWGATHSRRGINSALAWCDYSNEYTFQHNQWPHLDQYSLTYPFHGSPIHGYADGPGNLLTSDLDQFIWGFMNNMAVFELPVFYHLPAGTGPFDGWPHYFQGGHQQMYYKWLERAYQGGMRLLVSLAVNNTVLCEGSYWRKDITASKNDCRDMNGLDDNGDSTVDRQLKAMDDLERFIESRARLEGKEGWLRIVETPEKAREVIKAGKLAVIKGIEVDTLFNCYEGATYCTPEYVRGQIEHYRSEGVRYIFPVHFYNNAFTGGAWYGGLFVATDLFDNKLDIEQAVTALLGGLKGWDCDKYGMRHVNMKGFDILNVLPPITDRSFWHWADCNPQGLTDLGVTLLDELIEQDMIIDIDHLPLLALHGYDRASDGTFSLPAAPGQGAVPGALEIFEDLSGARGYTYPVHSGHPQIMDRPVTEFQQATSTIKRIRDIGGIAAVNMARGRCKTTREFVNGYADASFGHEPGRHVKGYVEIVELMNGDSENDTPFYDEGFPAISLITDMGAFLDQTGPRFARNADMSIGEDWHEDPDCEGKGEATGDKLKYAFDPQDDTIAIGKFGKQKTGGRTFDFNADGLAHIGLMPDLLADVRDNIRYTNDGRDEAVDLEPLFNSAETFVRMWERIENCTPDGDAPVPSVATLPAINGVCSASITSTPTATDNCAVPYGSLVAGTTNDPMDHLEQGIHEVLWHYVDDQGNHSEQVQVVSVLDEVPPVIDTLSVSQDQLWPANHKMVPITVAVSASDNCDAAPQCSITAVSSNEAVEGKDALDKAPDSDITGPLEVDLRAERYGAAPGREYRIEVTCTDYAGNLTQDYAQVLVPHDMKEKKPDK